MDDAALRRCLKATDREGLLAQVAGNVVDHFTVPLALRLGATAPQIGWLVAVPPLLAAVAQLFVVDVLSVIRDRRRLLIVGAALQGLLLVPIALIAALGPAGAVPALTVSLAAFRVVGGVMGPAWGSLMSEYLPEKTRGQHLGRRSRMLGLCSMLNLLAAGALLKILPSAAAFACVFSLAAASRLLSCRWMAQMPERPEHPRPAAAALSPAEYLRRLRESNFARFCLYVASMTFATQLASSYFSVHMLRDLGFDYLEYSGVRLASLLGAFTAFPLWGRHADHVGNARVIRLTGSLVPLIPVPWMLFDAPAPLMAAELLSGFVWSGFHLCASNFVYEAVPAEKRVQALGYFNVINGLALFAGAALGGQLAVVLPPAFGSPLHALFALSVAARAACDLLLARGFKEVRADASPVGNVPLFFSVVGLRPLIGRDLEFEARPGRPVTPRTT